MFGFTGAKLIAYGVVILALVALFGYLELRVTYYKSQANKYETQYNAIITEQTAKVKALQIAEQAQDAARQTQSTIAAKTIFDLQNQHLKDIHANAQLKSIVIPDLARQLFNATTAVAASGPDQKGTPGNTNQVNGNSTATLEDLLTANEENKKNYEVCSQDKLQWIELWTQTVSSLNGSP